MSNNQQLSDLPRKMEQITHLDFSLILKPIELPSITNSKTLDSTKHQLNNPNWHQRMETKMDKWKVPKQDLMCQQEIERGRREFYEVENMEKHQTINLSF
jgi:hypothetical protein